MVYCLKSNIPPKSPKNTSFGAFMIGIANFSRKIAIRYPAMTKINQYAKMVFAIYTVSSIQYDM